MQNNDGVQVLYKGGIRNRRNRTLARLEAQLKSGIKNMKVPGQPINSVFTEPLTDKDKTRIKKEIEVLKSKI